MKENLFVMRKQKRRQTMHSFIIIREEMDFLIHPNGCITDNYERMVVQCLKSIPSNLKISLVVGDEQPNASLLLAVYVLRDSAPQIKS